MLKISTKGRYGIRAALDLAMHGKKGPVFLADIAKRQRIPRRYLGHLMTALRDAGIVTSLRGAGGGFSLARDASEIRILELFEALEGPVLPIDCIKDPEKCPRMESCIPRGLWRKISEAVVRELSAVTLSDLSTEQELTDTRILNAVGKESPASTDKEIENVQ